MTPVLPVLPALPVLPVLPALPVLPSYDAPQGSLVPPHRRVTVSGQSAGASMAIQHLIAFSSSVDGAAIAAGSPYGCGMQKLHDWRCYYGGLDMEAAERYVRKRFQQGLVDDPSHLRQVPVVLFSGRRDLVVFTRVMRAVEQQLRRFVAPERILTSYDTPASHVWSVDHGSECACGSCPLQNLTGGSSLLCCDVNHCGYDLSGELLRSFYGPALRPRVKARTNSSLVWLEQWAYLPRAAGAPPNSTMLRWAPAYVPHACRSGNASWCRVHVNYHGCTRNPREPRSMGGWAERLLWLRSIDLNEYAEANHIVVLYPQAAGSIESGEGCFNWASYTDDPLFDTRLGIELTVVRSMVADLPGAINRSNAFGLVPPGRVDGSLW